MYLLSNFKRTLGAKDKQKRKLRFPKKEAITLTKLLVPVAITAGVGATLGKKHLYKNATKDLNKNLRYLIRKDRTKLANEWKQDYIKSLQAGKNLGNTDIDAATIGLSTANANKKYYSKQYKQERRKTVFDDYKRLNSKKKEIGSALGISTLIPLSIGYGLNKRKNKNKK